MKFVSNFFLNYSLSYSQLKFTQKNDLTVSYISLLKLPNSKCLPPVNMNLPIIMHPARLTQIRTVRCNNLHVIIAAVHEYACVLFHPRFVLKR